MYVHVYMCVGPRGQYQMASSILLAFEIVILLNSELTVSSTGKSVNSKDLSASVNPVLLLQICT